MVQLIEQTVRKDGATIYADEFVPYRNLTKTGYGHKRIQHNAQAYVKGYVHTIAVECF
ncbi:MAG: transposase [Chloroflexi bacterium]|nr:transposase [Chloroflexota bacterium]